MANPNHPAAPYQGGEGSPPTPRAPAPEHYAGGADAVESLAARVSQVLKLDDITVRPNLFSAGSFYDIMLQPQPRAELLPPGTLQNYLLPQGAPIEQPQQHHFLAPRAPTELQHQHYFLAPRAPTELQHQHRFLAPLPPTELQHQHRFLAPLPPTELQHQHRFLAPLPPRAAIDQQYPRVPPSAAVYYGPRGGAAYYGPRGGNAYYGAAPASVGHHHHYVPTGSVVSAPMALVETSARRQQQEGEQHAAQTSRLPRHLVMGAASTSSGPRPSNATGCQDVRGKLIDRKDIGLMLTSTWSAQQVVQLVESGDEQVQSIVLEHVRLRIRTMMADKEGSKVFLALVHRGNGKVLASIVEGVAGAPALITRNDEEFDNWINSLRSVITAVAEEPFLIKMLLDSLLNKKLMDSSREEEFTKHLFNTVSTEILLQHAIDSLTTNRDCARHMSGFLMEVYGRASGKFLSDIEDLLIENAMGLAVGTYSTYLLQHVVRNCSPEMKRRLVEKLTQNIVGLCADQQGEHVMHHCFKLPDASLDIDTMQLVLDALIGLDDDGLSGMVNGTRSSTVICEALKKRQCSPELNTKVRALALRIKLLPEVAVQENESSKAVLRFADRALRLINPNIHDS